MKKILIYLCAVLVAVMGVLTPAKWTFAEEFVEDSDAEISDKIPEIYIKAVNPGYATDLGNNAGEMIEIARKNTDEPISLAGATVGYTYSSGKKKSVLLTFPEGSWFRGETILLRLASSPESELANETYTKTISKAEGGVTLEIGGEVVDEVCWGWSECKFADENFQKKGFEEGKTVVRDLETGEWEQIEEYEPDYDPESYFAPEPEPEVEAGREGFSDGPPQCKGVQFSEVLSYYETLKAEQFIELYNPNADDVRLDGCVVRYKNKNHVLTGVVGPEGYFAYYVESNGFTLTKNPTSSNDIKLIDVNGEEVDKMVYPNGQRKGTSYALIGYDEKGEESWRVTYAPTPGEANNYQEFKTCETGKVLNKATGNCVKATVTEVKTCKEGYFMNPLTGRCNKVKTVAAAECKPGYYRDPTTNRCRKVKENKGADYDLAPAEYKESSSFVALYAVLGVAAVGGVYLIYEYRHEIGRKFAKVARKVRGK